MLARALIPKELEFRAKGNLFDTYWKIFREPPIPQPNTSGETGRREMSSRHIHYEPHLVLNGLQNIRPLVGFCIALISLDHSDVQPINDELWLIFIPLSVLLKARFEIQFLD
jgi:hypothetical protein